MIVDPLGRIMNEILDNNERVVCARIPIAQYRAEHSRPHIRTEIYIPVLEQYPGQFPPNLYSDYGLPTTQAEAGQLLMEHARFWSYPTANR